MSDVVGVSEDDGGDELKLRDVDDDDDDDECEDDGFVLDADVGWSSTVGENVRDVSCAVIAAVGDCGLLIALADSIASA